MRISDELKVVELFEVLIKYPHLAIMTDQDGEIENHEDVKISFDAQNDITVMWEGMGYSFTPSNVNVEIEGDWEIHLTINITVKAGINKSRRFETIWITDKKELGLTYDCTFDNLIESLSKYIESYEQ